MGKKGKRAKKKVQPKKSVDDSPASGVDDDDNEQVENGWVFEMREAAAAVKRDGQNEENTQRLARSYRNLRLWGKLDDLASTARKIVPKESSKSWREEAKRNLSVPSVLDEWDRLENSNLDLTYAEHPTWNNLNVLHFAICRGDVRLLEKAVALGAAIDYPIGKCDENNTTATTVSNETDVDSKEEAPLGATALLMACMTLAMYGVLPPRDLKEVLREDSTLAATLNGILECAILLVNYGANCKAVLSLSGEGGGIARDSVSSLGFNNKNAYQLAVLSRKPELFNLMKAFESTEDKIRLAYCRCGSRLPWLNCHGNPALDAAPYYDYDRNVDSRVNFRLSPFTDCICRNNKKYKKYFNCCWQDKTYYQEDWNGTVISTQVTKFDAGNDLKRYAFIETAKRELEAENGVMENHPTAEEVFSCYRNFSLKTFHELIKTTDPDHISKMYTWNPAVCADIMERIDRHFQWTDLHWHIPKSELVVRVKEWNDALSKYCSDKNLTAMKREEVVRTYTASPFAPCASPSCAEIETRVKEFGKCTKCNRVAYCSRQCQKDHWPTNHRNKCCSLV